MNPQKGTAPGSSDRKDSGAQNSPPEKPSADKLKSLMQSKTHMPNDGEQGYNPGAGH